MGRGRKNREISLGGSWAPGGPAPEALRSERPVRVRHQGPQILDVLAVVLQEDVEGVLAPPLEPPPQPDRIVPPQVPRLLRALEPELGLDRLETAGQAEGVERVQEVRVELLEAELGPPRLEEGEVEAGAVERDDDGRPRDC